MTTITRDILKAIRGDIDAALAAVGEKHGVILKAGNASFSEANFTFKLEGTIKGGVSKIEFDYIAYSAVYPNLPPLHSTIIHAGKSFKVCGWKGRSLVIENDKGKQFRLNPEYL